MNYKRSRRLGDILGIAGVAIAFSLYGFMEISALFIIAAILTVILAVGGLVIKIIFYRCPYCHSGLPLRTLSEPVHCPNCGKKLEP